MGKKRQPNPSDPFDAFVTAWGFHSAATALDQRKEVNVFAFPVMVNGALCLELFLKCLLLVRGNPDVAYGHDLSKLFARLSGEDQRQTTNHLESLRKMHPLTPKMQADGILLDVDSILL